MVLEQVNSEEVPDDLQLPENFEQLISEMKSNKYKAKEFGLILKGMVCQFNVFMLFICFDYYELPTSEQGISCFCNS